MQVQDNAGGQTALGWLESGKLGSSTQSKFEKIIQLLAKTMTQQSADVPVAD